MLPIREFALIFTLALVSPTVSWAQERSSSGTSDTAVAVVDVSPKQGKLSELLKAEAAKAIKLKRTPFVEIGAEWCGQCRDIKAHIGDKRMINAFAGTYIIRLDADAWAKELPTLGFRFGAVPVFFPVDTNGKPAGTSFTTDPLGENTPEHVAAPLQKFFHEHLWKNQS
jgi:thiol:disulfide interchange protein